MSSLKYFNAQINDTRQKYVLLQNRSTLGVKKCKNLSKQTFHAVVFDIFHYSYTVDSTD